LATDKHGAGLRQQTKGVAISSWSAGFQPAEHWNLKKFVFQVIKAISLNSLGGQDARAPSAS